MGILLLQTFWRNCVAFCWLRAGRINQCLNLQLCELLQNTSQSQHFQSTATGTLQKCSFPLCCCEEEFSVKTSSRVPIFCNNAIAIVYNVSCSFSLPLSPTSSVVTYSGQSVGSRLTVPLNYEALLACKCFCSLLMTVQHCSTSGFCWKGFPKVSESLWRATNVTQGSGGCRWIMGGGLWGVVNSLPSSSWAANGPGAQLSLRDPFVDRIEILRNTYLGSPFGKYC